MEVQRDSFVFYRSYLEAMEDLDDSEQLHLYRSIAQYALNGVEPKLSAGVTRAIFKVVKPNIDSNTRKYLNGKKGGAPKGSKNNPFGRNGKKAESITNQELTNNKPRINQEQTKNKANVNVNVNESTKVDDNADEKLGVFIGEDGKKHFRQFGGVEDIPDDFPECPGEGYYADVPGGEWKRL